MDSTEMDELAGRLDGVAQAVLRLSTMLEMADIIDGPHLSEAWRQARPEHLALGTQLQASRKVLLQMAEQMDAARANRHASQ